jgi:hypothetical protein
MFSRNTDLSQLNELSKSKSSIAERTMSAESSPDKAGELPSPGQETTTFHFLIKTRLGWIAWKEKEAGLYR